MECDDNNEEIDIETIPEHESGKCDITAEQPYQHILTDIIRSEKHVEALLQLKNELRNECPLPELELKDSLEMAEPFSQDWQYIQYLDNNGLTYRLAVNNETHDIERRQNNVHPEVSRPKPSPESNHLYQLLRPPSDEADRRETKSKKYESPEIFLKNNSDCGKRESFGFTDFLSVDELMEENCLPEHLEAAKEQKELLSSSSSTLNSTVPHGAMDNFQPITEQLVPAPTAQAHSAEEIPFDVVGPSPSNPEPALEPTLNQKIGPFCTAVGIFLPDLCRSSLPPHRQKVPADHLTNGVVCELHATLTEMKCPRRVLLRVLTIFFDIKEFDYSSQRAVDHFWRRTLVPMLTERTKLVKNYAMATCSATRSSASQTRERKRRHSNSHDPDVISEFDSSVFFMPPQVTSPSRYVTRASSRAKDRKSTRARERKPTQGEQLHDLQNRFDAFRCRQRKHNGAFMRRISIIQKQLDGVIRILAKRPLARRRHSMPASVAE